MADEEVAVSGWYEDPSDPSGRTHRFWDGSQWTEWVRSPGEEAPAEPVQATIDASEIAKPVVFAISLGFGAAGAASLIAIPLLAFYFPLGLGIAGAAVAIAGLSLRGPTPWFAVLAIIASVAAILQGGSAYNDYKDNLDQAQQSIQQLP
jgi:hypothetical protein